MSVIPKLCVVVIILVAGGFAERALYARYQALGVPMLPSTDAVGLTTDLGPGSPCTAAPEAGTTTVPAVTGMSTSGASAVLSVRNDLHSMIVVVLGDAGLGTLTRAIAVGGGAKASVRLAPGAYGLGVMVGERWCNLVRGFAGGAKYAINGGITATARVVTQAMIRPGQLPDDVKVTYRTFPEPVAPAQSIDLVRAAHGYVKAGAMNGVQAQFDIDPTAPLSYVSAQFARAAGIECVSGVADAASLPVGACLGLADSVTLGPLALLDLPVLVAPGASRAVLGANFLSRYRVESGDMTMHIALPMTADLERVAGKLARTETWDRPAGVGKPRRHFFGPADFWLSSRNHLLFAMTGVGLLMLATVSSVFSRKRLAQRRFRWPSGGDTNPDRFASHQLLRPRHERPY